MSLGVIASVRDLVPLRSLSYGEHMRIARAAGQPLLEAGRRFWSHRSRRVITELPRVQVERMSPFPVSGATHMVLRSVVGRGQRSRAAGPPAVQPGARVSSTSSIIASPT